MFLQRLEKKKKRDVLDQLSQSGGNKPRGSLREHSIHRGKLCEHDPSLFFLHPSTQGGSSTQLTFSNTVFTEFMFTFPFYLWQTMLIFFSSLVGTSRFLLKCMLCVLVAQLCPTLCNPMNCSPPGLSVHGIFQARILEWIAIPFSRGISQPRDRTLVSCLAGRFFTV